MVTQFNLLYSVSAVRRLLGLSALVPIEIHEFACVIWAWVRGNRPTFISKSAFKVHFVERRKVQARALLVTRHLYDQNFFSVRNEAKNSIYTVEVQAKTLLCQCEDYRNQLQFLGQACCKHGYACDSLAVNQA
jgi:hypothetical protein